MLLDAHKEDENETGLHECCANNIGCAAHVSEENHCKLCYHSFEAGSDLEYIVQDDGVKENIVLHEKRENYKFVFVVKTGDMEMLKQEDGSILIACHEGAEHERVVFHIPAPVMYDAEGESSKAIQYSIKKLSDEESAYLFAITADPAWINAQDRAFPVVIDPQVFVNYTVASTIITMEQEYTQIPQTTSPEATMPEDECGACFGDGGCSCCNSSNSCGEKNECGSECGNGTCDDNVGEPTTPPDEPSVPPVGLGAVPTNQYWLKNNGEDNYWLKLTLKTVANLAAFKNKGTHLVRAMLRLNVYQNWGNTHFKVMYNEKCVEEKVYDDSGNIYLDVTPYLYEMLRDGSNFKTLTLYAENGNYSYIYFNRSNFARCYIDYIPIEKAEENGESWGFDVGSAGAGSIHLSTGKTTFAHHDVTVDSALTPLALSHVFTSKGKGKESISVLHNNKQVTATPSFGMGNGWKLNVQQSLVVPGRDIEYSENLLSDNAEKAYYFDAEGARHTFEKKYYYLKNGVKHFVEENELKTDGENLYTDAQDNYAIIIDGIEEIVYGKLMDENDLVLEIDKDKTAYFAKKNQKKYFVENGNKKYIDVDANSHFEYTQYYFEEDGKEVPVNPLYIISLNGQWPWVSTLRHIPDEVGTMKEHIGRHNILKKLIKKELLTDVDSEYFVMDTIECEQEGEEWVINQEKVFVFSEIDVEVTAENSFGTFSEMFLNHYTKWSELNNQLYEFQRTEDNYRLQLHQTNDHFWKHSAHESQVYLQIENTILAKASADQYTDSELERAAYSAIYHQEQLDKSTYLSNCTDKDRQKDFLQHGFADIKRKKDEQLMLYRKIQKEYNYFCNEEKKLPCDILLDENGNKLAFDYYGRLVAVEDSSENAVAFIYDDFGRLEKILTADERAMILQYNAENRLDTLYDMAGRTTKYCYDENGYLAEIRLPEYDAEHPYAKVSFTYTENGDLASIQDASGYGKRLEYGTDEILLTEYTVTNYVDDEGVHGLDTVKDGEMTKILFTSPTLTSVKNSRTTAYYQFENSGKLAATYEKDNLKDMLLSQSAVYREKNKVITTQSDGSRENLLSEFMAADVAALSYATFENDIVAIAGSLTEERTISKTAIGLGDNCHFLLSLIAKASSAQLDTTRETELEEDEELSRNEFLSTNASRTFGIEAEVTYEDDTTESFYASFDWFNSDWQLCQLPIRLKATAKSITATFCYDYNVGVAQIKDFRLTAEHGTEETFTEDDRILTRLDKDFHTYYTYNDGVHPVEILQVRAEDALAFGCTQNCATCAGKDSCKHAVNKYGYDAKGRLLWCEDGNGIITEHTYNEKGQVTKTVTYHESDPANKLYAEHVYDEQGREIETPDPRGEVNGKLLASKTTFVDNTTIPQSVTAPNGAKTAYGYHHLTGLLTSMTSDDNGIEHTNCTKYMADKLVKVDNPAGMCYNYKYDGFGRLLNVSINGESHVTHGYAEGKNEKGDLLSTTHTATLAGGESFSKTADVWARTVDNTYQGDTYKETTYDDYGRVIREIEYPGTTAKTHIYTYSNEEDTHTVGAWRESACKDEKGRVTEKTYAHNGIDVQKYGFTYEDTFDGKLASMLWNNALREEYKRDALGRLTGIITHNGTEKLHSRKISYLKYGDHATNLVAALTYTDKNGVNSTERYGYNEAGHIDTVTENGRIKVRYTYDNLDRLVREDNKALGKTFTFLYDNGGNILLKREYAYTLETEKLENLDPVNEIVYGYADENRPDQLTSFNGEAIAYNENGMPTTYRGNTCTYKRATLLETYGSHTFDYDANGLRTKKNDTVYTYIGGKLIREENSGRTIDYIYGNDGITGIKYNGTVYLFRKNVFGDVTHIYDTNGLLHARYIYDAWGNHTLVNDTDTEIGAINPIRYRSYYYDTETKLYYLRARYYDPETGRFISQDNVSYLDLEHLSGLNLYAYCNGNPVSYNDATGHLGILLTILIATAIGAAIGGGVEIVKQAYNEGEWNWEPSSWDWNKIGTQTLLGAANGLAYGLGGVAGGIVKGTYSALKIVGQTLTVAQSVGVLMTAAVTTNFVAGYASYTLNAIHDGVPVNPLKGVAEGVGQATKGMLSFFMAGMYVGTGYWEVGKAASKSIGRVLWQALARAAGRTIASFIPNFIFDNAF